MTQRVEISKEEHPVDVVIFGKNIEVTPPIKKYIMEKVEKIERMSEGLMNITVRIEVQKLDHMVHLVMKFSHFKIAVHASTEEMYSAIDKTFDRLKTKLRKWKTRIQDHHAKGLGAVDLEVNVIRSHATDLDEINDEIEEVNLSAVEKEFEMPKVYKSKKRALKVLNIQEAVMKMELSHDNFLIYQSEEDRHLKALYRRNDGNYGLIALGKLEEKFV